MLERDRRFIDFPLKRGAYERGSGLIGNLWYSSLFKSTISLIVG